MIIIQINILNNNIYYSQTKLSYFYQKLANNILYVSNKTDTKNNNNNNFVLYIIYL